MSNSRTTASPEAVIVAAEILKCCFSSAAPVDRTMVVRFFDGVLRIVQKLKPSAHQAAMPSDGDGRPAGAPGPQASAVWVPALNPRDSISEDGMTIYCLVDGVPLKMLKRYIKRWGFTPDSYRQAFGLPGNYPMTAPGYAALKSAEAKRIGLGTPENKAGRKAGRKSRA